MPKGTTEEELERVSKDIERAAKEIGVSIVGGILRYHPKFQT